MARKRASLKDKGTEVLRPTKKSRGIDVFFGESTDKDEEPGSQSEESQAADTGVTPEAQSEASKPNVVTEPNQEKESMPANASDDKKSLTEEPATPPAALEADTPASLPVNEADVGATGVTASENVVDELGLPVAMETPPADLVLAVPPNGDTGLTVPTPPAGEQPLSATEPEAPGQVTEVPRPAPMPDEADLSGLAAEVPEVPPVGANQEADLSGLEDHVAAPRIGAIPPANLPPGAPSIGAVPAGTVSMPGPAVPVSPPQPAVPEPVMAPASPSVAPPQSAQVPPARPAPPPAAPPSGRPVPPPPAPNVTPRPAPPPAAPPSARPAPPPPTAPPPPSVPAAGPAFSPATPELSKAPGPAAAQAPSLPRDRVESLGGVVTERIQVLPQDIRPDDVKDRQQVSNIITVKTQEEETEDAAMASRVIRFVGHERREKLDQEIEILYDRVAAELSTNKEDTEYALETLRKAQDLVFENPRQYDQALYLVATVRTMLTRKRNLGRWSYTWGLFVFFYAFFWLLLFLASFIYGNQLGAMVASNASDSAKAVLAAWFSALAGGIGGVIGILYSLYWHVAMKQDFDRQYIMYYLVQPIMGFVLGAVVYFIVASGFLLVNFAISSGTTSSSDVLASTTVIALQVLLGWIAGFRQRFVFEMIDKIVQRISPQPVEENTASKPVSLAPTTTPGQPNVAVEVNKPGGTGGTTRVEVDRGRPTEAS